MSVAGAVRPAARHENLDRVRRMFALFVGVGYLGYLLLLGEPITALASRMAPWWTPVMVAVVFVPGLSLLVLSHRVSIGSLRVVCGTAALSFFVAVVTWPLAWDGSHIKQTQAIWFSAFPGLASLAGVIAWPAWAVFVHLVTACISVQWVNFVARGDVAPTMLAPEILFAIMYCLIFVGAAVMALRTGRLLDETTEDTHASAAAAAARQARAVERERFDALIHDSVISTLLTAARGGSRDDVPALAAGTLAELDEIRAGGEEDRPMNPERAVVHLRASAAAADGEALFEVTADRGGGEPIPADAVRSVGAAAAEALRNARRHGGLGTRSRVTGIVGAEVIDVQVIDDGPGFDPAAVSSARLGIAVSIRGRMDRLAGGTAEVDSTPGRGTVVRLRWERP